MIEKNVFVNALSISRKYDLTAYAQWSQKTILGWKNMSACYKLEISRIKTTFHSRKISSVVQIYFGTKTTDWTALFLHPALQIDQNFNKVLFFWKLGNWWIFFSRNLLLSCWSKSIRIEPSSKQINLH